jgi:cobalamin biosynthesis protein CbiD
MLSGEATNTNFIVLGLTRLGLKPMIYHTQGKHANHYATKIGIKQQSLTHPMSNMIGEYIDEVIKLIGEVIIYNW